MLLDDLCQFVEALEKLHGLIVCLIGVNQALRFVILFLNNLMLARYNYGQAIKC